MKLGFILRHIILFPSFPNFALCHPVKFCLFLTESFFQTVPDESIFCNTFGLVSHFQSAWNYRNILQHISVSLIRWCLFPAGSHQPCSLESRKFNTSLQNLSCIRSPISHPQQICKFPLHTTIYLLTLCRRVFLACLHPYVACLSACRSSWF